jgi:hypothetical protein
MKKLLFFVIILCLFPFTLYAADVIYVQSLKAKIMSHPKFDSQLLCNVNRGDMLQVVEFDSGWYKVSTESFDGWINGLCVAEHPPMNKITVIKGDTFDLEKNARRRSSTTTSAAAARGLTPAERRRLSDENYSDYYSLNELENFTEKITDEEVEAFINSQ